MSVSQKKSWNPGKQKMDYAIYNEHRPTPQDFVKNFVATDQRNWFSPEDARGFRQPNSRKDLYSVTEICPDGEWVELHNNTTNEKRVVTAREFQKWQRSMWDLS